MRKNDQRTIFEVKQDMLNRLELTKSALMTELGVEFDVESFKKRIEAIGIEHTKENSDAMALIASDILDVINKASGDFERAH